MTSRPLSFKSWKELKARIKLLPKAPEWECTPLTVEGGTTKEPILYYHRKGLKCFRFLVGNPIFREHSEYVAYKAFADNERTRRLFGSGMSGDWADEMQVCFSLQSELDVN